MTNFLKFKSFCSNNYIKPFFLSFRVFTSKTKLKEFSLASFPFKLHVTQELQIKHLINWYKKVNSTFCIYLLQDVLENKQKFYQFHIHGIDRSILLNKIFSQKSCVDKIQHGLESMYRIKGNSQFSTSKNKIEKFFSDDSLISLENWLKCLSQIKGRKLSKTSGFIFLYKNLSLINQILQTNKTNNWGCVLFDLLLDVYEQKMTFEDNFLSDKDFCLDTEVPVNFGSAPAGATSVYRKKTCSKTSGIIYRDILFAKWHNALNFWTKNSIFLIVDEVHQYIKTLYRVKSAETEYFLRCFDLFRRECRTHLLSRKELVPSKIIDATLIFPMDKITVSDYAALTWDSINSDSEFMFKEFPKSIADAFVIPIILANVSYLLDLEHFSPDVYNSGAKQGHFYAFVDLEGEACIKLLDMILEELDLFEKESKFSYNKVKQAQTRYSYSLREDIWNLIVPKVHLPMVCPPKNWIPDQKGNQLYDGGYLFSSIRGYRGVTVKNEPLVNLEPRMICALNNLQSQSYNIDVKMLYYILDNYDYALKHFLLGTKSLGKHAKVLEALFVHAEKFAGRKLTRSSNFVLDSSLRTIISIKIKEFFSLITFAVEYALFEGPFYFVHYIDQRFRTYPVGSLISTQGSTLAKSLFVPSKKNTDEDPVLFQKIPAVKHVKEQILSRQTGKSFFPYMSLILNNNILKFVSIDVSSSGSQIYGAMVGDLQTLELTNFMIKSAEKINRKDFYNYVLDNYLKKVGPELDDQWNSLCIAGFSIHLEDHADQILKFKNLFTRNMAKGWIMRFFFSQGKKARRKELYQLCIENSIFDYVSKSRLSKRLEFLKKLEFFETAFIETLSRLFPNNLKVLSFHKNIISTSSQCYSNVGDNKGYYLSADKTLGRPLIRHFITDTKKIILIRDSSSRSSTNLYSTSCVFDKSSAMVSIAANATQNRDAVICFNILLEGFALGKPIIPSHDAFVCRVQDVGFIQCAYYNNFKRLLIEGNIMLDFLLSNTKSNIHKTILDISLRETILTRREYNKISLNGTLPSLASLNLLIQSRKNRIEILRLIESGEYIMNPYVLS
jgi:hypothetical protein